LSIGFVLQEAPRRVYCDRRRSRSLAAHGNKTSLSSSPLTWLFNPLAPPASPHHALGSSLSSLCSIRSRVFSLTMPQLQFALSLAETIDNCSAVNYALSERERESSHTHNIPHTRPPLAGWPTHNALVRTCACEMRTPLCVLDGVELRGYGSQVTRLLTPGARPAHFLPSFPLNEVLKHDV
jgi:hypothetical protein